MLRDYSGTVGTWTWFNLAVMALEVVVPYIVVALLAAASVQIAYKLGTKK